MVVPIPAQVSKLRPCVPAAPHRRSLPLLTTHHSLPSLLTKRRHLHHVAPISLPFSAASAYFPSPRGCTLHHSRGSDVRTCKRANAFVYKNLPPLYHLLRALALCFQWLAASFCKTPGW